MRTYHGSCHCGVVAFEADLDPSELSQCNCSICSKKGALHRRVKAEQFRLLHGDEALQLYQFCDVDGAPTELLVLHPHAWHEQAICPAESIKITVQR